MNTCKWINQNGQRCGQPASHWPSFSHGNGLLTTPQDYWINPDEKEHPYMGKNYKIENYEMREGDYQCPWQGASGRCILRLGHFPETPHKEMIVSHLGGK